MEHLFKHYNLEQNNQTVSQAVQQIIHHSNAYYTGEHLKKMFGLIDLTSLNATDNEQTIKTMALKVSAFTKHYPAVPNVAAICVYPNWVGTVKKNVGLDNFNIAAVVGGFPAAQTFIEIKTLESQMAIKNGATEADMVISLGQLLASNYQIVFDEIQQIKTAIGNAHLKVILESGLLTNVTDIKKAGILAIEAGADFIKTSTGKEKTSATYEAAFVMCTTIKEYYARTGKKIGFKPAGGISNTTEALKYYAIVDAVLGEEWLNPMLFRFGASSLANHLLNAILDVTDCKKEQDPVVYF